MQCTAYNPDADPDEEHTVAKLLDLSWPMRGPTDGRAMWKGNKLRPNKLRYANPGSFKKKVARIFKISGHDQLFCIKNKRGALACIARTVVISR
jgi:hypothetical protein